MMKHTAIVMKKKLVVIGLVGVANSPCFVNIIFKYLMS